MTLAKRLIEAREKAGLSQEQLANKVGIKQQSISQIEDGVTKKPRHIEKIAEILEVSPSWLLFGQEEGITYFLNMKVSTWSLSKDSSIKRKKFPENYYSLIIESDDDSMINTLKPWPSFPPGTLIVVNPIENNDEAKPGNFVIAKQIDNPDSRPIFRLYGTDHIKRILAPLNRDGFYEAYPTSKFNIIGVVVASMNLDL